MNSRPSKNPSTSRKPGPSHRQVMSRIILGIVSVVLITITILGLVNVHAISTYNQATRSLNTGIAELSKTNSDPTRIAANQDQAEQLFHQAQALTPLLLPKTRQAIEEGKTVSAQLTQALKEKNKILEENQSKRLKEGETGHGSNTTSGSSGDKTGLSQEQQDKVDKLLRQNHQQPSPSPSPGSQSQEGKKPTKPW